MNAGTDKLAVLVTRQYELQKALKALPDSSSPSDRIQGLRIMVLACIAELYEALDETGWKPWATSNHIHEDAAFSELGDALQFLLNAMMIVKPQLPPEDLAEAIFEKHSAKVEVNRARMAAEYDGLKGKCGSCRRALDDPTTECTATRCAHTFAWVSADA